MTFKGLKNLKVLNLSGVKLSDTSIVYFQKFQNLHELNLSRTEITDLALERLLQFPLRFTLAKFFLIGTKITNKGLLLLSGTFYSDIHESSSSFTNCLSRIFLFGICECGGKSGKFSGSRKTQKYFHRVFSLDRTFSCSVT